MPINFKLTLFLLPLFALPLQAADHLPEKHYQKQWCDENNGIMEVRLDDGTRIDCLTRTHAVEVEFARKWAEAVGQSLYYAKATDKTPGIVLIVSPSPSDQHSLQHAQQSCKDQHITLWTTR